MHLETHVDALCQADKCAATATAAAAATRVGSDVDGVLRSRSRGRSNTTSIRTPRCPGAVEYAAYQGEEEALVREGDAGERGVPGKIQRRREVCASERVDHRLVVDGISGATSSAPVAYTPRGFDSLARGQGVRRTLRGVRGAERVCCGHGGGVDGDLGFSSSECPVSIRPRFKVRCLKVERGSRDDDFSVFTVDGDRPQNVFDCATYGTPTPDLGLFEEFTVPMPAATLKNFEACAARPQLSMNGCFYFRLPVFPLSPLNVVHHTIFDPCPQHTPRLWVQDPLFKGVDEATVIVERFELVQRLLGWDAWGMVVLVCRSSARVARATMRAFEV
ncbi:hypothetical protein R3P38DRAFT_2756408 [Favolaschia claudopus]|uniref:Uncharacterized protein n=1 Tax=Favolaschia claudopus TaxID=2862362 RepID=A0AAW0EGA5_9AGAR